MKHREAYREYLLSRVELLKSVVGTGDINIGTIDIMLTVFFDNAVDLDSIHNDVNTECEKYGVYKVMPYSEYIVSNREGELDKLGI